MPATTPKAVDVIASFAQPQSKRDASANAPEASVSRRKTETSGLGLSAGLGTQYSLIGVQVAYYLQLPNSRWRIAPYASIGTYCFNGDCTRGELVGAMGSWGRKHRFLLDAFCGTVDAFSLSIHGESPTNKGISGVGLAAGYEYMAFNGFFLRGDVGAVYGFGPPILAPKHRFDPALTFIGVGYKFW